MLLSNQVRKILVVSLVFGLTACGGGSDSSAAVVPTPTTDTSTTTPTPTTDTSTSTTIEYASGIYLREYSGKHTAIIINDNTLYYHPGSDVDPWVGKFTDLNDFSSDTRIIEAIGSYRPMSWPASDTAIFSTTFEFNENNIVTGLSGYQIQSGGSFAITTQSLSATTGVNELSAFNGQWKDAKFTVFTIDDALALTAVDKNGCEITGVLTENTSQTFDVSLTYSNCELAGDYSGVLWAYAYGEETYLSWLAYNGIKSVSGSIDTFLALDESVLTSGQLTANVYTSGSDTVVLTKADKIYAFNSSSAFILNYQNESKMNNFIATGRGIASKENVFDAQTDITVAAGVDGFDMRIDYQKSSGTGIEFFRYLDPLPLQQRLATVAGTWDGLSIAENGDISGNISGCVASGTAGNYQENIADIAITLSDCSYDDVLTGVAIAIERSDENGGLEKVLILSIFNDHDAYVLGINTVVTM